MNTLLTSVAFFGVLIAVSNLRADEQEHLQGSVQRFHDALIAGDADRLKQLIHFDHDQKDAVSSAQAERMVANRHFVAALQSKFEIPHGEHPFAEYHLFTADDFAFAFGTGEWEIKGNVAVLPGAERMGGPDQLPPPPMRKLNGVWKVDLSSSARNVNADQLAAQIKQYADVLNATAKSVTDGNFNKLEQVDAEMAKAPRFVQLNQQPPLTLEPVTPKK